MTILQQSSGYSWHIAPLRSHRQQGQTRHKPSLQLGIFIHQHPPTTILGITFIAQTRVFRRVQAISRFRSPSNIMYITKDKYIPITLVILSINQLKPILQGPLLWLCLTIGYPTSFLTQIHYLVAHFSRYFLTLAT